MALLNDRIMVTISASADGAIQELQDLEKSTSQADTATLNLGKTLKTGLVAGAAALAGTGLVSFLSDSAQAFVEAQETASQFARATNASVEEAGKFTQVAGAFGLEMYDLIEINAEFAKKIEEQPDLLEQLNIQVQRNADGTVNMTKTLVSTIDALGAMENGLEAAKIAADLFGEEGSKQLASFYLAGIEVQELMDRIDFVDNSEQARAFTAQTAELGLAFNQLQITVGSYLVPALTTLADAGTDILGFFTEIPAPVYAAIGAFTAFQVASSKGIIARAFTGLIEGSLNLASALASPKLALEELATQANKNPLGVLVGTLTAAYVAVELANKNFEAQIDDGIDAVQRLEEQGTTTAQAIEEVALQIESEASLLENAWAALRNTSAPQDNEWWQDWLYVIPIVGGYINDLIDAFRRGGADAEEYQEQLQKVRDEMGEMAAVTADAAIKYESLEDAFAALVESGKAGTLPFWEEVGRLAAESAEATRQQEEATRLAAEAFAIAAGDAEYFLSALRDLENIGGSSVESIKASLENIQFSDVADTWANEALIGAENAYDTIVGGLIDALERQPDLDLSSWLDQFRGLAPELDAVIDQILADASTDAQLQAALEVARGKTVDEAEASLNNLEEPRTGSVDVTTGEGFDVAKARKEDLAAPATGTIDLDVSFLPGGYNAVKARKDYLKQDVRADIDIDVSFGPGGYNAVKARKDYLSRDTTAYIDVVVRGLAAAQARIDAVDNAIGSNAVATTFAPTNLVKVSVDGRDLRAAVSDSMRSMAVRQEAVA